ncbi:MAG: sporulation protein YqfC [Firmicutes bacterium]|nr:sporulation protein YqfC [Bacillota bacterium]
MAKTFKGRFLQNLTTAFELPADVVLNLPRITITGNVQLLMENHKGIISYDPEKIRIRTQHGEVAITGTKLKIDSLFASEVRINGHIHGIEFLGLRG